MLALFRLLLVAGKADDLFCLMRDKRAVQCDDAGREFVVNATARRTKHLMAAGGGVPSANGHHIDYAALRAYRVVF